MMSARNDDRYALEINACILAVRNGFPHLNARDIINPPHQWFDAALARQVVMHLMIRELDWPKRRVVEIEDRSREAINRALRTIDQRLETPRFETHYRRMACLARELMLWQAIDIEAAA